MNKRCLSLLKKLELEGKIKVWWDFEFHLPFDNGLRLKDILESEVDEKYYLSDEYLRRFIESLDNKELQSRLPKTGVYEVIGTTVNPKAQGTNSRHWVYSIDKLISTIDATTYKQPKQILTPNEISVVGRCDLNGNDICKRVYSPEGVSATIPTGSSGNTMPKVLLDYRIRKLTPKECLRLQSFDDGDYEVLHENGISNSQIYKVAGNSIAVCVLEAIFNELLCPPIEPVSESKEEL